jgi:RHS repeat-associated protein
MSRHNTQYQSTNTFQALSHVYRYGFQGQEEDQEMWEGAVSYKYRVEDARLGRFFSVDPLTKEYPFYSTYAFSGNRVIDSFELEGLEPNNMHSEDGIYGDGLVDTGNLERGDFTMRLHGSEGAFEMVGLYDGAKEVGWLARRIAPAGDPTGLWSEHEMKQDAYFVALDKFGEFKGRIDEFFEISEDAELFDLMWGDIARSEVKSGIFMLAFQAGVGNIFKFGTRGDLNKIVNSGQRMKSKDLDLIGHSFDKHSRKNPALWGVSSGNSTQKNSSGLLHVHSIYSAPGKFTLKVSDSDVTKVFLEKVLPDGRGLRLNRDGTFKGFIDPINK